MKFKFVYNKLINNILIERWTMFANLEYTVSAITSTGIDKIQQLWQLCSTSMSYDAKTAYIKRASIWFVCCCCDLVRPSSIDWIVLM